MFFCFCFLNELIPEPKEDGWDVLFDDGGGIPAFIFGSNLPILWLLA